MSPQRVQHAVSFVDGVEQADRREPQFLTTREICRRFGISRWTWHRWVRSRLAPPPDDRLPGHPRWHVSDIERFEQARGSRFLSAHRTMTNQRVTRRLSLLHHAGESDEVSR